MNHGQYKREIESLQDIPLDTIMSEQQLADWLGLAPGAFNVSHLARDPYAQMRYTEMLEVCVRANLLERVPGRDRGWYRPKQTELQAMDYQNALDEPTDIWLPFNLSDAVEIYPSSVIIISGAPNAGKTALLLNVIKENRHKFDEVHYFNSEMDEGELKKRLRLFPDITLDQWKFNAWYRSDNFADVIKPGANCLNIIDFLEVHDEFYMVGRKIKEIHDKLKGSVAFVALQKNPGQDTGLGGYRSMEVARLALALDYGKVKVTKAKNWRDKDWNPNGRIREFSLVHGYNFISKAWHREVKDAYCY